MRIEQLENLDNQISLLTCGIPGILTITQQKGIEDYLMSDIQEYVFEEPLMFKIDTLYYSLKSTLNPDGPY